jgi:hypothetical protein
MIGQVARNHPDAAEGGLAELRAMHIAALRLGHDNSAVVGALNAAHRAGRRGDPIENYINAVSALGQPAAA